MKKTERRFTFLYVLLITLIGIGLRGYAANRLPIDYDERVYLEAATQYNNFMRQGRWTMLAWNDYNYEHPAFYKILYGFALFTQPPLGTLYKDDFVLGMSIAKVEAKPWGMVGRYLSLIFGSLTTFVLAVLNPIAGLAFATNTMAIKYSSTFFLEALPSSASFLSALCYLQWFRQARSDSKNNNFYWLIFSAGLLGVSIASKYMYGIIGVSIGIHYIGSLILKKINRVNTWKMIAWGSLVAVAFFICDPFLWRHTFTRLYESVFFHKLHSEDPTPLPFWQPLIWLSTPFPKLFENATIGYVFRPDLLIAILAIVGLPRSIKTQPLYVIWFVLGMVLICSWPRKWPQYTMLVMVPVCLFAANGLGWIYMLFRSYLAKNIQWRLNFPPGK